MNISITYCNKWNYLPRAASLATKLLDKYGNAITQLILIPSDGGVFDVSKNDHLIFSKKKEGRFPELDEIFTLLD